MFASGPDDIWFAGSHGAAHYDGDIWSSANTEQLTDLWGNGPDDVWMLDFAGNAIHWDGNTLQKEPLPDGFSPTTATGAGTELWVTDYWTPTIAHRRVDGEWELLLERPYGSVGDAVVDGDGILWAATVTLGLAHQAEDDFVWDFDVGDRLGLANGVVVTFDDDRSFRRTTSGGWEELGDAAILYEACTASDGSVWAVGDRLARLEGDRWVPDGPAVDGRMYQVECGGDTVFAFDSADMLQRHGDRWSHDGLWTLAYRTPLSSFAPTPDSAYVVLDGAEPWAMQFDGTRWTQIDLPFEPLGVGGRASDVWIVGTGHAAHQEGGQWVEVAGAPAAALRWVTTEPSGRATVVDEQGGVWSWTPGPPEAWRQLVPPQATLTDVVMTSGGLFAVDDSGHALRLTGTAWTAIDSSADTDRVEGNERVGIYFQRGSRLSTWDGTGLTELTATLPGDVFAPTEGAELIALGDLGEIWVWDGADFVLEDDTVVLGASWLIGHSTTELWATTTIPAIHAMHRRGGTWELFRELSEPLTFTQTSTGETLWLDRDLALWRSEPGGFALVEDTWIGGRAIGAWFVQQDDIWATVDRTLRHYDGESWTDVPDPIGYGFASFAGSADGPTYALGIHSGVISLPR
ncbi:MAG: hypothetical protein H6738_19890 [Alphaproteobacteria bacterium]|nr:hypothetical protein [Alphaproteobacteria bacterium]MCB9699053.1 hypothetical protein [Alphaproteobacteria bacterium]